MEADREKISTYQLILLFAMSGFSPAIRLLPALVAKTAKQAGWLTPTVSAIGLLVLVFIIQSFFKSGKNHNLSDVYMNILGKFFGRLVLTLYSIWFIVLLALYTRYYAERILSSTLPDTTISFFILAMLVFIFIVLRGGLVPFARFNELIFYVFMAIFTVNSLLSLFNVKITNLLPISHLDIIPVVKSTPIILAVWAYYPFMFFFADKVNDKEHVKRIGIKATIITTAASTILLITTVGVLGSSLAERVSLPYFLSIKQIAILDTLERLESITLAVWVAADFIIITSLCYICLSTIKSLFKLSGTKSLASPLILITYVLSLALAKNRFELETFSIKIFIPANVLLGFIIPIIVFFVGKIRKVDKS